MMKKNYSITDGHYIQNELKGRENLEKLSKTIINMTDKNNIIKAKQQMKYLNIMDNKCQNKAITSQNYKQYFYKDI